MADLLEKLAELEHQQWWEWASAILRDEEISVEREARWRNKLFKPYAELTETQKEQDREWARKVLKAIRDDIRQKSNGSRYLTDSERKMSLDLVFMQITLGLQTCKTKGDVVELLKEVYDIGFERGMMNGKESKEEKRR